MKNPRKYFRYERKKSFQTKKTLTPLSVVFSDYNPEISGLMKSAGRNSRVNLVSWEKLFGNFVHIFSEITSK